jgi:hypothetical protein
MYAIGVEVEEPMGELSLVRDVGQEMGRRTYLCTARISSKCERFGIGISPSIAYQIHHLQQQQVEPRVVVLALAAIHL